MYIDGSNLSFGGFCGRDGIGGGVVAALWTLGFQMIVCSTNNTEVVFVATVALLGSERSANGSRGRHGVQVHCVRRWGGSRKRGWQGGGRKRVKWRVRALCLRC